jgi:hypothetical protein
MDEEGQGGMLGLGDLPDSGIYSNLEEVDDDIDIEVDDDTDETNSTNLVFRGGATDTFFGAQKSDGLDFVTEGGDGNQAVGLDFAPVDPDWGLKPRKLPAPRSRKQTMFVPSVELSTGTSTKVTESTGVSPAKSKGQKPKIENKSKGSKQPATQKSSKKKVSKEVTSDEGDDSDDVVVTKVVNPKRGQTASTKASTATQPSAAKKRRTIPKRTREEAASGLPDSTVTAAATVAATAAAAAFTAAAPNKTQNLNSETVVEVPGAGEEREAENSKLRQRVQALENQLNRSIQHRSQAQAQLAREREVHTRGLQLEGAAQKEQHEEALGKLAASHEQAFKAERHEHERAFKLERQRFTTLVAEQKKTADTIREADTQQAPREAATKALQKQLELQRQELERLRKESAAVDTRGRKDTEELQVAHAGAIADLRRGFDAEKLRWAREFDMEASRRQMEHREHLVEKLRWAREWDLAMRHLPFPTQIMKPEMLERRR